MPTTNQTSTALTRLWEIAPHPAADALKVDAITAVAIAIAVVADAVDVPVAVVTAADAKVAAVVTAVANGSR